MYGSFIIIDLDSIWIQIFSLIVFLHAGHELAWYIFIKVNMANKSGIIVTWTLNVKLLLNNLIIFLFKLYLIKFQKSFEPWS